MALHLYGLPASSFTWTVRILLHEKSIAYEMGLADSDTILTMHASPDIDRHPYRKIPILDHDGKILFETQAICRYLDHTIDGPSFTPDDPYDAGLNDQWMSVLSSYVDRAVIRGLVLPSVIARAKGTVVEKDQVVAAAEKAGRALRPLEKALDGQRYLLGDQPMLADFFLWPILYYLKRHPAGARLLKSYPNLRALFDRIRERPGFTNTLPG